MRIEPFVALVVSAALHAAVLLYVPATIGSRDAAQSPPVPGLIITASLKNTLEPETARSRRTTPGGHGPGKNQPAVERKPRRDNAQRFYPPEAVARGLEGETILMLTYDAEGALLDAKVARSSGHAILDAAALRAIRASPRMPPGAREVLFPVTFALQ
jgi:periplasmic protein TonB